MDARFARYATTGALGTAAHYAVMAALLPAASPVLASTFGAVIGGLVNYALTRRWVFSDPSPTSRTAPRYLVVALGGLALNALVLQLLAPLGIVAGQLGATLAVLLGGFAVNRQWTFEVRST